MGKLSHIEFDLGSFDLDADGLGDFADLEVVALGDAMAMPETGASSGVSSCSSCSCCLSTSCCSLCSVSEEVVSAA